MSILLCNTNKAASRYTVNEMVTKSSRMPCYMFSRRLIFRSQYDFGHCLFIVSTQVYIWGFLARISIYSQLLYASAWYCVDYNEKLGICRKRDNGGQTVALLVRNIRADVNIFPPLSDEGCHCIVLIKRRQKLLLIFRKVIN